MQTKTAAKNSQQNDTNDVRGKSAGKSRRPYKFIYVIDEKKGQDGEDKSFWTKVGIAFENRDGSFSMELSAMPVNGRLHMRDPAVRAVAEAA